MLTQDYLAPSIGQRSLFPRDVVFAPRAGPSEIGMLGFGREVLDTVTSNALGGVNGGLTVRHESGVTPEILGLLARSGIRVSERTHTYSTPREAAAITRSLIRKGCRMAWVYPPAAQFRADPDNLVPVGVWRRVNSKCNLHELVPARYLAERRLVSLGEAGPPDLPLPVFLKAATDMPTGGGHAVRYCETRAELAAAWQQFRDFGTVTQVIVEEAVEVRACWCVSLLIDETGVHYIGAAEQLFEAPGQQIGNLIDDDDPFPAEGVAVAKSVGERARALGFRGPAGMDIGVSASGRIVVFDPNFRLQASTMQSMFHRAAAQRTGARASRLLHVCSALEVGQVARILGPLIDRGQFVVTRMVDGRKLPVLKAGAMVTGFVLGADRHDAIDRHSRIVARLDRVR